MTIDCCDSTLASSSSAFTEDLFFGECDVGFGGRLCVCYHSNSVPGHSTATLFNNRSQFEPFFPLRVRLEIPADSICRFLSIHHLTPMLNNHYNTTWRTNRPSGGATKRGAIDSQILTIVGRLHRFVGDFVLSLQMFFHIGIAIYVLRNFADLPASRAPTSRCCAFCHAESMNGGRPVDGGPDSALDNRPFSRRRPSTPLIRFVF
jgi:hypothetical protein